LATERSLLEQNVLERTAELSATNRALTSEIAERHRVEASLREAEARFRGMFERHQAIMLLIEPHTGAIMDANAAAAQFYGFPLATLRQMHIEAINCLLPDQVAVEREHALAEQRNYFIFPHQLADGTIRIVEVHSTPMTVGGQELLFSIIHDITERKRDEETLRQYTKQLEVLQVQLREQAIRDPLTGAFNRRYLVETLEREITSAARNQYPLCLMIIDIDHFKAVNDTYGHLAGDHVLRELTHLLQQSTRKGDIVCRYGGEEFVVLMPHSGLTDALWRAEALRSELQSTSFPFAGSMLAVTVSIGLATTETAQFTCDELLSQADRALFRAKAAGRNRVIESRATNLSGVC
jgi:diguanylate cyclase (GGDEF)-like protein/PAS domain S-box-containing protein